MTQTLMPVTWLWGAHAVRLTGALQNLCAQHIHLFNQHKAPAPCPQLCIVSSEPAPDDDLLNLPPQALIDDMQSHSGVMIDLMQQALGLMCKQRGQHKGTLIVLSIEQPNTPVLQQVTTLTRQAGLSNLTQSLAREWNKCGIHVVYLSMPADTPADRLALLCWQLHQQPMSSWSYQPQLMC